MITNPQHTMSKEPTTPSSTIDPSGEYTTLQISGTGGNLEDRVQMTMSIRELWYFLEVMNRARLSPSIGGTGDPDPVAIVNALHAQMEGFWIAVRGTHCTHVRP